MTLLATRGQRQSFLDTQDRDALADSSSPQTITLPDPNHVASAANTLTPDQQDAGAHSRNVGGELANDHPEPDAHVYGVVGNTRGGSHPLVDVHPSLAAAAFFSLDIAAATLDDVERLRMATANRVGAMEREGFGDLPEVEANRVLLAALEDAEHQAALTLKRALRRHPLGAWVKRTVGIGEKQGARMLAAIGDPAYNFAADRPRRGPAELWQYAGHGDPARSRRRKGEQTQFSPDAKMRVHLVAESCIKQAHSPYRPVYDAARAAWADRETSDMHKHNHALRMVGKAILRDLWLEARDIKEQA